MGTGGQAGTGLGGNGVATGGNTGGNAAGGVSGVAGIGGAGMGGAMAAGGGSGCAKVAKGRYLIRADGALLLEGDPPATSQTAVLDASTVTPLTDVADVQDATYHGCALQGSTQTVWCWRTDTVNGNVNGQLGNGATDKSGAAFRATQVLVSAGLPLTNVVAIADGETSQGGLAPGESSCAVTGDGKLYCWGVLSYIANKGVDLAAPFATVMTTDGSTPLTGVQSVALDASLSACAIVQGSTNELWCWGYNNYGQLGLGDTALHQYPTKVGGLTNPRKVVMNGGYTLVANGDVQRAACAIDGDNVKCWGYNGSGSVATGTTESPVFAPTTVRLTAGGVALNDIADLHSGDESGPAFCALITDGTLRCWGGPFGNLPALNAISNVTSLGGLDSNVRAITADGVYHEGSTSRQPNCGALD